MNIKKVDSIKRQCSIYMNVVEPGITSFECQKCGKCCAGKYVKLPMALTHWKGQKECIHHNRLTGLCRNYKYRPNMCLIYPFLFSIYPNGDAVLYIYKCEGFMKGKPMTLDDIRLKAYEICAIVHEKWDGVLIWD